MAYLFYLKSDVAPGDPPTPANKLVEIRIMSSRGGEFRTFARLFGGQGTINVNSWLPDISRLAIVSYKLKG